MPPRKKSSPSKRAPQKADSGDESDRAPTPEEGGGVDVHEAYRQYRLGGAKRAERLDPDVYRRASEEWQSLPGAFRTTPPPAPAAESETTGDEPTPDEANDGEPS